MATLLKAAATLNSFSTIGKEGNTIFLDDIYKLVEGSEDGVTLSLLFYNIGVSTNTIVSLGDDVLFPDVQGSINVYPIGKNRFLSGKELSIVSNVVATNLSTSSLPFDFKASLILKGGRATAKFPIQGIIQVENVGDQVNLILTVYFY